VVGGKKKPRRMSGLEPKMGIKGGDWHLTGKKKKFEDFGDQKRRLKEVHRL